METGVRTGMYAVSGSAIEFTPATPFRSGELVYATITDAVTFTTGPRPHGEVWQMHVESSGSGSFVDSGQTVNFGPLSGGGSPHRWGPRYVGDVDLDGDLDVFSVSCTTEKVWLFGSGLVDLGASGSGCASHAALGDLDLDGDLDAIVLRDEQLAVLLNQGGTFAPGPLPVPVASSSTEILRRLRLGDLDADGDLDAMVLIDRGDNLYSARWMPNDGQGFFFAAHPATDFPIAGTLPVDERAPVTGIALGDFDGDGDLDLNASTRPESPSSGRWSYPPASLWSNDGAGNFVRVGYQFRGFGIGTFDVNDDGRLDVVLSVPWELRQSAVWHNRPTGGFFTYPVNGTPLDFGLGRVAGDVDGDADLDLPGYRNSNGLASSRPAGAPEGFSVTSTVTVTWTSSASATCRTGRATRT